MGVEGESCDTEQDCDCVEASDDCVMEGEEEEKVGESGIHHCNDGGPLVYLNREGGNLVGEVEEDAYLLSLYRYEGNEDLFLAQCGITFHALVLEEKYRRTMGFHSFFYVGELWTFCGEVSGCDDDSDSREEYRNDCLVKRVMCMKMRWTRSRIGSESKKECVNVTTVWSESVMMKLKYYNCEKMGKNWTHV